MKNLLPYLVVLLFLMPAKIFGQKVIYFNRGFERVKSIKTADFYQIAEERKDKKYTITRYSADSVLVMRGVATETYFWGYDGDFVFYSYGHKRSEGVYKKDRKEGMWKYYNDSGTLEKERFYRNGSLDSIEINFYTSGEVRSKTGYANGKFMYDTYFNKDGQIEDNPFKEITDTAAFIPTRFKGDIDNYFYQSMSIPGDDLIEGTRNMELFSFAIDTTGEVVDFDIVKSISPKFDHEFYRLFSLMPKWEPATKNGKPIKTFIVFPYRFDVPIAHHFSQ